MEASAEALPPAVALAGAGSGAMFDACLDALGREATTPTLLLCAPLGPAEELTLRLWQERTDAHVVRVPVEPSASPSHRLAALLATARDDVVLLAAGCVPAPGALERLRSALRAGADIASATPWSNDGELASFPRIGECHPPPDDLEGVAKYFSRCSTNPELPMGGCHAVALRIDGVKRVGGMDCETYSSSYAALVDLFLRQRAWGLRHVLAGSAYAASSVEQGPGLEDLQRLNTRFPGYGRCVAEFLMADPLRPVRAGLERAGLEQDTRPVEHKGVAQGDLFG